jgi:hypothetical protein
VEPTAAKADPRLAALDARERKLHKDAVAINAIVQKRWNVYHSQLVARKHQIAARKKAQQALAQQVLAAQQTPVSQSAPSYSAPSSSASSSHAASAPSAPIVRVAPPAAPPATQTKTS